LQVIAERVSELGFCWFTLKFELGSAQTKPIHRNIRKSEFGSRCQVKKRIPTMKAFLKSAIGKTYVRKLSD